MLGGLADEAEGVRTAALAAGRTLVDLYTLTALELLLPAILAGTSHANWRIRQSSVELLGDLLYKVGSRVLGFMVASSSCFGGCLARPTCGARLRALCGFHVTHLPGC